MLKPTRPAFLNVTGPQLRALRLEKGWSQATLAAKCQVKGLDFTRDTIANIELRRRWVADHELVRLAAIMEVGLRELLPPGTRV